MRKFILLDPSLAKPGGHHCELAVNLTAAAARAGYEVHVVAHRRLAMARQLTAASQILRVFEFSTYKGASVAWGRVDLPVNPYQPANQATARRRPGPATACLRARDARRAS